GHRPLDDLKEIAVLFPGVQVGEFFVGGGPLIVVKDRDRFHSQVKDAPPREHARRRLLRARFPYTRRRRGLGPRLLSVRHVGGCSRSGGRRGFNLFAELAPIQSAICHSCPLSVRSTDVCRVAGIPWGRPISAPLQTGHFSCEVPSTRVGPPGRLCLVPTSSRR